MPLCNTTYDNNELDDIIKKFGYDKLPDDVSISTMTINCETNIIFNHLNIAKYIELNEKQIIDVCFGNQDDLTINRKINKINKKINKKTKKKEFNNQVSLHILLTGKEKAVNCKLFTIFVLQLLNLLFKNKFNIS